MPQKDTWEREYSDPQLLSLGEEPRSDLKQYMKFLRRKESVEQTGLNILELGSGTGRNCLYLAEMGNHVVGMDISATALNIAKRRAKDTEVIVDYLLADIGAPYAFDDGYFDLIIDIMSSNSLSEAERAIYMKETHRVLKKGGHFFVRTLCKDGDKNAKNMLKLHPGKEYDTYINKDMNLTERVFSRDDFVDMYSKYFEVQELTKKTNYASFKGQSYKRNYWLAYMKRT